MAPEPVALIAYHRVTGPGLAAWVVLPYLHLRSDMAVLLTWPMA